MTARRLDGATLPRFVKIALALLALAFAAAWVGHHGYLRADWLRSGLRGPGFALRHVDFLGVRALDRAELCRLAGVLAGTPLVDLDPERAADLLAAHPRIARARAMRLPPDRLVISLVERVPVALEAQSGLALDSSGERFPPLSDEVERLPLLSGDPRVALPVIAAAREQGLNLASVDARGRGEVRVRTLGRAVQLVVGRDAKASFADWRQLAEGGLVESQGAQEVDLRFRSNPVLRDFKRTMGVKDGEAR
jgi:cell division septal protein FtsQ